MILAAALQDSAFSSIARDQTEAIEFSLSGKIVVMGGITPAQTTDAVAAVLAERIRADVFINLTSVDGIYSADPRIDPTARHIQSMTPVQLLDIIKHAQMNAGANTVIDIVAARVVERSGIPLVVMDGRDPENLYNAIFKGIIPGSVVSAQNQNPLPFMNDI
jgi:uridylate kinase